MNFEIIDIPAQKFYNKKDILKFKNSETYLKKIEYECTFNLKKI
jgi:hypothetical protein